MNVIQRLMELIPPPDSVPPHSSSWSEVENDIGLCLPEDYKKFIDIYGYGTICNLITIESPFLPSGTPVSRIEQLVETLKEYGGEGYSEKVSFYPDSPGILPCGFYGDIDMICWMTSGKPNEWKIIYYSRYKGVQHTEHTSLIGFVLSIISGECELFGDVEYDQINRQPKIFEKEC